jgi:dipeptidyl aminopeptidase/acylaminoacyl peptidase
VVVFIHGDDDRNVSFDQTVDLVRRLETTGVHYEVLTLPDETFLATPIPRGRGIL